MCRPRLVFTMLHNIIDVSFGSVSAQAGAAYCDATNSICYTGYTVRLNGLLFNLSHAHITSTGSHVGHHRRHCPPSLVHRNYTKFHRVHCGDRGSRYLWLDGSEYGWPDGQQLALRDVAQWRRCSLFTALDLVSRIIAHSTKPLADSVNVEDTFSPLLMMDL